MTVYCDPRLDEWVAEGKLAVADVPPSEARAHALRLHMERYDAARGIVQNTGGTKARRP